MVSSKADGRKNPIGLFVLVLAYVWSEMNVKLEFVKESSYEHNQE